MTARGQFEKSLAILAKHNLSKDEVWDVIRGVVKAGTNISGIEMVEMIEGVFGEDRRL